MGGHDLNRHKWDSVCHSYNQLKAVHCDGNWLNVDKFLITTNVEAEKKLSSDITPQNVGTVGILEV